MRHSLKDIAVRVWLQQQATSEMPKISMDVSTDARLDQQIEKRHASLEIDFSRLPAAGSSVDASAASAVEVQLPTLPSLKALLTFSGSSIGKKPSNDCKTAVKTSGLPVICTFASSAIVPPFVIWRNASFGTLERLARTVAVAARRAERFEHHQKVAAEVLSTTAGATESIQHADLLMQEPALGFVVNESIASLSNANDIVPLHITEADTIMILDQMLVHLARPLLCFKGEMRPARVLVLGDSHSLLFKDAASHYHDPGLRKTGSITAEDDVCALSNY